MNIIPYQIIYLTRRKGMAMQLDASDAKWNENHKHNVFSLIDNYIQ
jgi:hypothetical protein